MLKVEWACLPEFLPKMRKSKFHELLLVLHAFFLEEYEYIYDIYFDSAIWKSYMLTNFIITRCRSQEVKEALRAQMEMQRSLHEQVEVTLTASSIIFLVFLVSCVLPDKKNLFAMLKVGVG